MGKKSRQKKEKKPRITAGAPTPNALPFWVLLIVSAVAILAVVRTLPYEFVFDDQNQILRNTWIRDWANLGRFFTSDIWAFTGAVTRSNYYRPFQMVLYTIAYSIGGFQPQAFHLFNILLHALCSIFVALIGYRLSGSRFAAAAGGLIFALHPIHAESVAWVSGVTDPLCAAFYFSALYFYAKDGQERASRASLILALGLFLAALFSKEMAFSFPVAAVWLDWCFCRKLRWSRYAMLAGIFALYAVMRVTALHAFFVNQVPLELSAPDRILSSIVLLAQYLTKMFVPYGISASHVFEPTTSLMSLKFASSIIALAVFLAAGWALRDRRALLFLFGLCILTLAPVMNLTGIGENVLADRYLYIPTLGSCLLIPLLAQRLIELWSSRPKWVDMRAGGALLGLLLAVFAWMLRNEVAVWRDTPAFYLETLQRSPASALMAHNLACYYYYTNDFGKAQELEARALASWNQSFIKNPTNLAEIYLGFGAVSDKQGSADEARQYFTKAYQAAPDYEPVLLSNGSFHISRHEYDQALGFYEAVIRINPRNEVAYSNAAGIHLSAGRYYQAIACARKALDLKPDYSDACVNLARAYAAKGMREEARRAYLYLKKIDPSRSSLADAELEALDKSK